MKTFAFITIGTLFCLSVNLPAATYSGGDGTAANPYQIANKTDLLTLAATTADYNKCFILTADIDMGGQVFTTAIIAPDTDSVRSGFQGTQFTGIFDGTGHVISNLTITASTKDYIGLFGYVGSGGQIRNLGVENANITGHSYVGGLVGYNDSYSAITDCYTTGSVSGTGNCVGGLVGYKNGGTITECYATGAVSGTNYVGGLCGLNWGCTITYCYATGSVSGTDKVGGLVGYNDSYSAITDCYTTGSVSGTGSYVGGLVGYNSYGGTLISCYAAGSVDGTEYVGGLAGNNSGAITTCYATGAVSSNSNVGGLMGANNGTVTACFWDIQTSGTSDGVGNIDPDPAGVTGKTTAEMQMLSTFTSAGWDFSATGSEPAGWVMLDNDYPKLAWVVYYRVTIPNLKGLTEEQARSALTAAGLLTGETYSVYDVSISAGLVSETYPKSGMVAYAGLTTVHVLLARETRYSGGDGVTEPYQITNLGDWVDLMNSPDNWNRSFILTADIDLAGLTYTQAPIAPDTSTTSGFQGTQFTGIFDGTGHVISNLTITASTKDYISLFGYVGSGGQIRNLGVDVNITDRSYYYVGGLVGYNNYGSIISCYATGSVSGLQVSSSSYVGGLVGYNNYGTITYCYATGSVNGTGFYVGGLVGGNNGSLTDCYATGSVNGNSGVSGLVGTNGGTLTGCFWDIQTSGRTDGVGYQNPDPNGVAGLDTATMMTLSTFISAGWDFTNETANGTNDYWRMCTNGVNYPKLNWESIDGDLQCPSGVSTEDLNYFVGRWLMNNCTSSNNYCGGVDIDSSGTVNIADLAMFAQHWLEGI